MTVVSDSSTMSETGSERLWNSSIAGDLAFLLARANALSLAHVNSALEEYDLRIRQYSVLAMAASGERPTQRELSEFLRLDPSQVVALVDGLEKRGLVEREVDVRDRRAKVITATRAGETLCLQARAAVRVSEDHWFAILSEDDAARLGPILRLIAREIDYEGTPDPTSAK
ncbi:MAG: MarR family transcriptional regulator [Microbacteriaceae bacterium]|nr:MarR family transcriptional regulator [Microbacteriaceae bacterium]